ncbi:MAG: histidinol-phosphate transaminase [Nanoarchaeota archaeon]|nr:histidinol-phosphate transaminase [Nanoarchaeota archaeon]MBU1005463.1 histidinol-phosphate transaminase [Nanoarchaeota archaeon]MBU1947033.1 histidinol-phosphate transaminase [Nanoarchaeota archaeon]
MTTIKPRKAVMEMESYSPPLEGRRGMLRLDFNENTVGCSPKVLEALKNIKEEEIAAYPEYSKFKSKLAENLNVSADKLMVTNATDEAIMVIIQTYVEAGEEVIIPVPTFAMFKFYAQLAGAKIKEVPYSSNLSFPTKKVIDSINKKTKLIILCNPNNPTGSLIERKDVIKVIEKAQKCDCLVLLDEAYYQYSGLECLDLVDRYDNLIVIRTFSKVYGMGGLRLGYAVSNPEIIKNMLKAGSPYSVNTMAMYAASVGIDDDNYVRWYVEEVKQAKKLLYNALAKMKIKAYPSTANFLIAKFPKRSKEIEDKLKEKGILVRDRSSYPLLKDCLRIGVGTVKQTEQLISAIKEII